MKMLRKRKTNNELLVSARKGRLLPGRQLQEESGDVATDEGWPGILIEDPDDNGVMDEYKFIIGTFLTFLELVLPYQFHFLL